MSLSFGLVLASTLVILAAFLLKKKSSQKSITKIEPHLISPIDIDSTPSSLADLGYDVALTASPSFTAPQQSLSLGSPNDLLMIYLMAPVHRPFLGYELIQALLATDLRHGAMGLFHRYDEQGHILFSVAQTTQTGAFDLDKMGGITCRGLILFMPKAASAFLDQLAEAAYQLAEDLDGHLEDRNHQPIVTSSYFDDLKKEYV